MARAGRDGDRLRRALWATWRNADFIKRALETRGREAGPGDLIF